MKSSRTAALAAAVLIVPLAALVPAASAGETAGPPFSAIATIETSGAQPTAPSAMSWQSPESAVTLSSSDANTVVLSAADGATVTLAAEAGRPFETGSFGLGPSANSTDGQFGARLVAPGVDVDSQTGTIVIQELTRDAAGAITAFAADLTGGFTESLTQSRTISLRYQSSIDYVGVTSSPPVNFGERKLGYPSETKSFTVTVTGPRDVTFGAAVVQPRTGTPPAVPVTIANDGCNARTLTAGQSCTVTAYASSDVEGTFDDLITVPAQGGAGSVAFRTTFVSKLDRTGRYHAVTPKRAYDSRSTNSPIGPGGDRVVKVAGVSGVPATARAVVLSVTAVSPTSSGYLTVHTQPAVPTVSHVNFRKGVTKANLVTTPMDANGNIRVYNRQGSTHLLVDVVGWFNPGYSCCIPGSQYELLEPERILDTRTAAHGPAFGPGEEVPLKLTLGAETNPSVTGVVVNLTAVAPTKGGYLQAWNGAGAAPTVSSLNYLPGQTVPVLAFIPTRQVPDGVSFTIKNGSSGNTHVLVDVVGFFDQNSLEGLRFANTPATRVLDTRNGTGVPAGMIGAATTKNVQVPAAPWNTVDTWALMTNVTAAYPTKATYEVIWHNFPGSTRPTASNLNAVAGDLVSNAVLTEITDTSTFGVYNSAGSTHLIGDVMGAWNIYPGSDAFPAAGSATSSGTDRAASPTRAHFASRERATLTATVGRR